MTATPIVIPAGMPQYDDVPRFDVEKIRADFPILDREVNGHRVVYLDSGNTSQKPRQVIDAMREHYERHNANVARSVHTLGTEATAAYEGARQKVATFIGGRSADEIVFTKNATEAINLVAYAILQREPGPVGRPAVPARPGRRDRDLRNGAPLQHRAVAAAVRAHRRDAALVRHHRPGPARRVHTGRTHQRADQARLDRAGLQHPRYGQRDRPHPRPGPRGRRAVHARRVAGGAAPADGRGRLRRRLPRLHRAQDARPDRHRCAVGPRPSCSPRCRRSSVAAR